MHVHQLLLKEINNTPKTFLNFEQNHLVRAFQTFYGKVYESLSILDMKVSFQNLRGKMKKIVNTCLGKLGLH